MWEKKERYGPKRNTSELREEGGKKLGERERESRSNRNEFSEDQQFESR